MDIETIEKAAEAYAVACSLLAAVVNDLREELDQVNRNRLPGIRARLVAAQAKRSALATMLEEGRALFEKRRTRTLSGIKVGFQKQRGRVEIADEELTLKRIRALLPADQAELLIRVRESVHKPAVYDLTAADLKRLGIAIADDAEVIVLKPMDDALDRLLAELLPATEAVEGDGA